MSYANGLWRDMAAQAGRNLHELERLRDGRSTALGYSVETRFLPRRFRFGFPGDPSGASGLSPQFGCVLVVWRDLTILGSGR